MKKNKLNIVIFTFLIVFMSCSIVFADSDADKYKNLCSDTNVLSAFQIIGWIIFVMKILVPLVLIVLGMVDFGKAVVSSDEKAISKATSSLVRRFIAGVTIFFIPTIVFTLLNITEVSNENNTSGDFVDCTKCMLKPNSECD